MTLPPSYARSPTPLRAPYALSATSLRAVRHPPPYARPLRAVRYPPPMQCPLPPYAPPLLLSAISYAACSTERRARWYQGERAKLNFSDSLDIVQHCDPASIREVPHRLSAWY